MSEKFIPSPVGETRVIFMEKDGTAKVKTVRANRQERRLAQKEANRESLQNYRELRRLTRHA